MRLQEVAIFVPPLEDGVSRELGELAENGLLTFSYGDLGKLSCLTEHSN